MKIHRIKRGFTSAYIAIAVAAAATAGIAGQDVIMKVVQDSYVLTETQQGGVIRNGVQSLFHGQSYAELSNAVMRGSNFTPLNKLKAGGDTLHTQWADDGLVLTPEARPGSSTGSWFGMTYKSLPRQACFGMSQNYSNFEKVEINGSLLYAKDTHQASDISGLDIEALCDREDDNQVKLYSK